MSIKSLFWIIPMLSVMSNAAPLVRYFELTTDPDKQTAFEQVGVDNLSQSIQTEAGTLAMYATVSEQPNKNLVFEIYQDEQAYQIHAKSAQFARFVDVAKTAVTERKVVETVPQFLAEKTEPVQVVNNQLHKVNFASVTVKPELNDAFKAVVIDEMQKAMNTEQGVLVMYAVTLKDEPNQWRFFEIYQDEQAYQAHRQTPHFQHYLAETAPMVTAKSVITLQGGTLMNKGNLHFLAQ